MRHGCGRGEVGASGSAARAAGEPVAQFAGDRADGDRWVSERDVCDPALTWWVDCEQGERGCTGGDYAGFMVADGGAWVCPSCAWTLRRDWEESRRGYWH